MVGGGIYGSFREVFFTLSIRVEGTFLTFVSIFAVNRVHFQIVNVTPLTYLERNGSTRNKLLVIIAKQFWDILMPRKIAITAEYLPGKLNVSTHWVFRHSSDASKWLRYRRVFQQIWKELGSADMDGSVCSKDILYFIAHGIATRSIVSVQICISTGLKGQRA